MHTLLLHAHVHVTLAATYITWLGSDISNSTVKYDSNALDSSSSSEFMPANCSLEHLIVLNQHVLVKLLSSKNNIFFSEKLIITARPCLSSSQLWTGNKVTAIGLKSCKIIITHKHRCKILQQTYILQQIYHNIIG